MFVFATENFIYVIKEKNAVLLTYCQDPVFQGDENVP